MFFCGIDCFNGLGMLPTWFDRYESTALFQWSVSILHNSDYAVAFQIRIVVLSEMLGYFATSGAQFVGNESGSAFLVSG
jgi:hypothetical protein